jgi:hypothetical protein
MSNTAPIACQGWKEVYPAAPTEVGMHSNLREVALYRELLAPASFHYYGSVILRTANKFWLFDRKKIPAII